MNVITKLLLVFYSSSCLSATVLPVCTFAKHIEANDTTIQGKTLQEVVVTGKEIVTTEDKMIIHVNENVKKYSHDGYSALQMLTIPGLDVDPIDEIVKTHGIGTLLCINGREASKDEIKTLNPKDIKRIDYYQNYHPEYPLAQGGVIDFIMRIRDHGGMLFLQANQSLNKWTGNDLADWKFYQKKSEIGIQLTDDYNHYSPSRGTESATLMPLCNGGMTKRVFTVPSSIHANGLKAQLSYLQRFDSGTLKVAVSLKNGHRANNKNMSVFIDQEGQAEAPAVETQDYTHSDNLSPAFSIEYRNVFKNKATFTVGLKGDYTDTEQNRAYRSTEEYLSETKEKFYHLTPSVKATYPFSKIYTTYLGASYYYNKSETDYRENGILQPSSLKDGHLHLVTSHRFWIVPKKFSVTLQGEERLMTIDNGQTSSTRGYFTPCLFYIINLPRGNSFKGRFGMGAYSPVAKYYSPAEKRIDEYQTIVGNPDQKTDYSKEFQMSFLSNHKWGMVDVFAVYENYKRPLYESVTYDGARDLYVHTFLNGGTYERFLFNTVVELNLIQKKLKWLGGAQYEYTKGHIPNMQDVSSLYPITELTYIDKGFQGKIQVIGKNKALRQNGMITENPFHMRVNLGYTFKNWFFNLYAYSPFMKLPKKTSYTQEGFAETATLYSPRTGYNMISLRVSYRFTYGKKHKFEHIETDDVNRTAILDTETK